MLQNKNTDNSEIILQNNIEKINNFDHKNESQKKDISQMMISSTSLSTYNIPDIEKIVVEMIKKKQRDAFKQHYYENHKEILKKKSVYNKRYANKNKKRIHCEVCNIYFISKRHAELHAERKKHQEKIDKPENKLVIKDNKKDIYIM